MQRDDDAFLDGKDCGLQWFQSDGHMPKRKRVTNTIQEFSRPDHRLEGFLFASS